MQTHNPILNPPPKGDKTTGRTDELSSKLVPAVIPIEQRPIRQANPLAGDGMTSDATRLTARPVVGSDLVVGTRKLKPIRQK